MSSPNNELVAFLYGLAGYARTDVYARYVEKDDGKRSYFPMRIPFTRKAAEDHFLNTSPVGLYIMTGSATRVAVLDLDDHDGSFGWEQVRTQAIRLRFELLSDGLRSVVFRSGGGKGIHIWILWSQSQPARDVRDYLSDVLNRVGFRSGTTGVANGTIEIFPKQNEIPDGKDGNLVALPLARRSLPLIGEELHLVDLNEFVVPQLGEVENSAVPAITVRGDVAHKVCKLEGDESEVVSALKYIRADDYETWIRVALILKHEFGDGAYELWRSWSETVAEKYPGDGQCEARWKGLNPRGELSIGTLFYLAKNEGWNGPSDILVREMNGRFGILTYKNRTLIIVKNGDRRPDDEFVYLTKPTFLDRLKPEFGVDHSGKRVPKGSYWLSHSKAAHYHRLEFDPERPPGQNGRAWNLWRGFGVQPRAGDWSLLQDHIFKNICAENEDLRCWLLNWMALALQRPSYVIGTAPVLRGRPGTGKGVLANAFGHLWGSHFIALSSPEHVYGRFNSHLAAKRFVFLDEAILPGKQNVGTLKARITEPTIVLEAKGVDAVSMPNKTIWMIASNEHAVVAADIADRRWQMFDVGEDHREDHGYFSAIAGQLADGGYEAMMHELMNRDWEKGTDPRRTIRTPALLDQIFASQPPQLRFLYEILQCGTLPGSSAQHPHSTTIEALFQAFRHNHPNERLASNALGRSLQAAIPAIRTNPAGEYISPVPPHSHHRSTRYDFPPLLSCRAAFDRYIGQQAVWAFKPNDWEAEDVVPI